MTKENVKRLYEHYKKIGNKAAQEDMETKNPYLLEKKVPKKVELTNKKVKKKK